MNQSINPIQGGALAAAGELLEVLGHEIANFRPGFKGRAEQTYIVSPYATEMFGLDIVDGEPLLGIPSKFYLNFHRTPWEYAAWIRESAGLFLVSMVGAEDDRQRVAFRLAVRKKRSIAVGRFEFLRCAALNEAGEVTDRAMETSFVIPLKEVSFLEWEGCP